MSDLSTTGALIVAGVFALLVVVRILYGPSPNHHLNKRVKHLLERDEQQQVQIDELSKKLIALMTDKKVKRVTIKRKR